MVKLSKGKAVLKKVEIGYNRYQNTLDGLPVVDAKKPLTLDITTNDIKTSRSKAPNKCAAAVACMRQFKAVEARVHLARTYLRYNGKWHRYFTPLRLQKEIISFDRGGSFEPGSYNLYIASPSHRLGAKKPRGPHKKKNGSKRGHMHYVANVREQAFVRG